MLLLAPLFAFATPAAAQSVGDPWFGPSDKTHPTQGWAIRVPVTLENTFQYPLVNPLASIDVDFGKLLVKAGWTTETKGTTQFLTGFTLDENSIRVVEYGRGFSTGPITGSLTLPTPAQFYPSPWHATKNEPYNNHTAPAGTILLSLKGTMAPMEKRYFYIYANPREFESAPASPAPFTAAERAPLDAYLWGNGEGTVFYGYEPDQIGNAREISVKATMCCQGVTVSLYLLENDKFVFAAPSTGITNPQFTSNVPGISASADDAHFIVPAGKAFKIVADRPVAVSSMRCDVAQGSSGARAACGGAAVREAQGFIPSLDGSYAGTRYLVFGAKGDGDAGGATSLVTLIKSGAGSLTVTTSTGKTIQLSPATPYALLGVPLGAWTSIEGTAPFLVSLHTPAGIAPNDGMTTTSIPALSGAVSGTEFYGGAPQDGGFYRLCADNDVYARIVGLSKQTLQAFPEGPTDATPPLFEPKGACETLETATTTPSTPLDFYSSIDPRTGLDTTKSTFRLIAGATGRNMDAAERPAFGSIGGVGGLDFWTYGVPGKSGRLVLFGHYNGTRLSITEEKRRDSGPFLVNTTSALQEDQVLFLDPLADSHSLSRYHIVATKPISVAYADAMKLPDGRTNIGYARGIPGRPSGPNATVGNAEFRGPLVELRSPDAPGGHDLPRSAGPGTTVDFRLDVFNLGRWIAGDSLPDTVTISCTSPEDWRVTGCARDINLASGASERIVLGITPSANDVNQTKTITVTAVSKSGGSPSVFKFIIYVEVRYGVGMWFGVEGGQKTEDPPKGTDPGQTFHHVIVIKNTGSTGDTYDLRVQDPKAGWTQSLLVDGVASRTVTLDAGESKTLDFAVTAPNSDTAPKNFVSISAQSQASLLSSDVVNSATQIHPKVSISLKVDPEAQLIAPGANATFNLTVNNSGNSIFLIRLVNDSDLPEGWRSHFSVDPPEVNLNPGDRFTFGLNVTPPLGARAGDLATLKITALVGESDTNLATGDQVSAVTVVRRVHNLTTPNLPDAEVEPGATLRYLLPITNAGNGNDIIEILPGAVSPAWRLTTDAPSLALGYNDSAEMPLVIDVPPGAPAGLVNLTFTVRLSRETVQNLTIPVSVLPVARLAWAGIDTLRTSPGKPTLVEATLTNTGNLAGEFALASDAPTSWNVTFQPPVVHLGVGDAATVRVLVNASRDAGDGRFTVGLRSTYAGGAAGNATLATTLARPLLSLGAVTSTGSLTSGELVLVSATVANNGDIAAENVTVALVVDGVAVDKVVLQRISVNDTKVATLNWVATGKPKEVHVVIDPQGEIVQANRDKTDQTVAFGSRLGIPGPASLVILAAVGALAVLLRRRNRS